MEKERIGSLDTTKFVLIALVILGHIFEHYMDRDSLMLIGFDFIFTFAMPSFILISGFFTNLDNPLKGIKRLLETYVIFQFLHAIVDLDFNIIKFLLFPKWTMWYLLSLVWWKVLLYFYLRTTNRIPLLLFLSVLSSVLVPFVNVPVYLLAFERTISLFPFFVLGTLFRNFDIISFKKLKVQIISCCMMLGLLLILFSYPMELRWLINWNTLYVNMPIPVSYAVLIRLFAICFCSVLSICVISLIPEGKIFIQAEGKNSLFYYMWHSILLTLFYKVVDNIVFINSVPICIIIWVTMIAVLFFMRQIKLFSCLLTPYTIYKKITK